MKQSCFQDERTGDIFTKNYLLPTEIFKGLNSRDTVIFLTLGGRVDDIISTVSHSTQVSLSETGIFLISQSLRLPEFYEISSYIQKLPYDRDFEAYFEGSHEKFPSWRLLREGVGVICGKDVTINRITLSDLQAFDIPEFCVKLDNASLDVPSQRVSFDVMAKSSIAGLEFARAEIPLKYPTELLGTNIVLNDKIEASKGIVINTSFYDISMYDVQDDEMVLAITSSCNGGESAFVLGTEYEKIADVTVDVETLGN
ncbi:MAG TPA: hypothetical protein ENK91_09610, partial [Bacteroidetes bacterium]|nr:hypothetical protein [Bacteroidota bacterium]